MHECYAMQILEKKIKKAKTTKGNGHKEQSNEAQGPYQKNLIKPSFFHLKLFRYKSGIGVIIHMRMMCKSRIGIKV